MKLSAAAVLLSTLVTFAAAAPGLNIIRCSCLKMATVDKVTTCFKEQIHKTCEMYIGSMGDDEVDLCEKKFLCKDGDADEEEECKEYRLRRLEFLANLCKVDHSMIPFQNSTKMGDDNQ